MSSQQLAQLVKDEKIEWCHEVNPLSFSEGRLNLQVQYYTFDGPKNDPIQTHTLQYNVKVCPSTPDGCFAGFKIPTTIEQVYHLLKEEEDVNKD